MEPVGPCQVREAKDEGEADIQHESDTEETPSGETAAKVMDGKTYPSAEHPGSESREEADDDTQLGRGHSASSAQQGPTDTVEKQYPCDVCKKVFMTGAELRRHERTHTGERPFECAVCGKKFTQSGNLDRHLRTHTGERPFKCTQPGCDKSFSRGDDLNRHLLTHLGQ